MARALFTNAFKRYLTQIFHISKQYPFWNDLDTWPQGAIVWYINVAYKALSSNTNVQPDTHPLVWEVTPVRTQRWWIRRNSQRLPQGRHQPNYPYGKHFIKYGPDLEIAAGNHRMVFLQICRAWQNASGFPYADAALSPISVDYTAWNTLAGSTLYQVRNNSYWKRSAFQWFAAYNLAASSVNGFYGPSAWNTGYSSPKWLWNWTLNDLTQPYLIDTGHPLCFVGTPPLPYAPVRITSASAVLGTGAHINQAGIHVEPDLGEYLDGGNPPTDQQPTMLLINSGPQLRGTPSNPYRTQMRAVAQPFLDDFLGNPPTAYKVNAYLFPFSHDERTPAFLTLRYIKSAAPWNLNDPFIPTAEPGPPKSLRAYCGTG